MDVMTLINEWLSASFRMAAPLILTGVGCVFTERVGIFNIGVEGMMLVGAMAAVAGNLATGSVLVGTIAGMIAGGLLAIIHAYLTVNRRASQIVAGAAINLFALGVTNLLNEPLYAGYEYRPRVAMYPELAPAFLKEIPILGPALFAQPVIVWVALILAPIATWILYRTNWGLNVRAVGDHPEAVASAGISVFGLKYVGVVISGVMAGLGGAALTQAALGLFAPNMTRGRGFIALAALAVGNWNPTWVAIYSVLFGVADALQLRAQAVSQARGIAIPYQFLVMAPYLLTIAALAGLIGKSSPPKTVGEPYEPEGH